MAHAGWLKQHRTWEDGASYGLGVLIGFSPWIAGQSVDPGVVLIAMGLGLMVMTLAQLELVGLNRWGEVAEVACGLALIALPFNAGYAATGPLRFWHFVLGALVALLALLELWQDRSDEGLAKQSGDGNSSALLVARHPGDGSARLHE